MKVTLVFTLLFLAQLSFSQSQKDTIAIKAVCMDYVEGFFTQDSVRLKEGLHPELIKRIIDNRGGQSKLVTIGLSELLSYLRPEYKIPDSKSSEPFIASINIYDITNGVAIAKIATNKMPAFFDYVQIGKINNQWKIINVLWAFYQ